MKKIILFILVLLSYKGYAYDYLKIIFSNQANIPTSTSHGDSIHIHFHDSRLNEIIGRYNVKHFGKEYPVADSFPNDIVPAVKLRLVFKIRLSDNEGNKISSLKKEIELLRSPDIKLVIPANDPVPMTSPPNDYYNCFSCLNGSWPEAHHHLDLINALSAWDITTGLSCIKIGISDVDFQYHNDLNNKVASTSRTAYIAPASTNSSHGVEVAGMAGAETNNNSGIASLGYNVGLQYYSMGYDGVVKAIYDGCKVVNCSWADIHSSSLLTPTEDVQEILDLANLNNVTIVAAAGNMNYGSATEYFYPASYDQVISVTSVGSQWNVGDFNNPANWKDCHREFMDPNSPSYNKTYQHNDRVDICAPGYYVETTTSNNGYGNDGGTSLSAPLVSAAAALLYSINPFFTTSQIEGYLKNNAANIYGVYDNYLWAGQLGAGRLDVAASLQAALGNAYTQTYCNECPSGTTYLTYTNHPVSGDFYNKIVYAGSNDSSKVVYTDNYESTNLTATDLIEIIPSFIAEATNSSSFSAQIIACTSTNSIVSSPAQNTRNLAVENSQPNKDNIRTYPNPTKDKINIQFNSPSSSSYTVQILNSIGMKSKELVVQGKLGLIVVKVDVSDLPSGLYYVVAKNNISSFTSRFVKIK